MKNNQGQLKKYNEDYFAVRAILNKHDFLKVVPEGIESEYEDLITPILKTLSNNPSNDKLSTVIYKLILDRYGLRSSNPDKEIAEKILNWWHSK